MKKTVKSIIAAIMSVLLLTQGVMAAFAAPPGDPPSGGGPPGGETTTAAAVSLMIHQVYGGGSSTEAVFSNSFIELFNDSGDDISLSGYTLTYLSEADAITEALELSLSGTVPAYSSFLIRCAATGAASPAYSISTSDLSWTQAISDSDYQIAVYDDSENLLDAVALGGSTSYTLAEGTAITDAISAEKAIRRIDFTDTDHNAVDFEIIDYATVNYESYRPHSTEDGAWTFLKDFTINIGGTENEIGISWFCTSDKAGVFQILKGSAFDESSAASYSATVTESYESGCYSNQVTISGLDASTTYVYRYGNDGTWSETGTYTTADFDSSSYSFIAVGDPQIGASGNAASDAEGWDAIIETALSKFSDTSFVLSVGDQINQSSSTSTLSSEYSGFFSSDELKNVPFAATVGNHDSKTTLFNEHYNLPNVSGYGSSGEDAAEGDYYFTYGNTLFMVLNTNNSSISEHTAFMEQAIDLAGDTVTWKVVVFHQSIYSVASHVNDGNIAALRQGLSPVLYHLDIDVVLMGHDHVYARSYIMGETQNDYGSVADNTTGGSSVTNPDGILYVTLNSASGSKYYNITSELYEYTAVMDQSKQQTYSNVTVTPNSFTITTYFQDGTILDDYTIYQYDSQYVTGYTTQYESDTLSVVTNSNQAVLLTNDDSTGLNPASNAAEDNNEPYAYLTAIPENAVKITVEAADNFYAYLQIYDASGVRCGGNLGWVKPEDSLTADLTSSTYSDAAYYTVAVKYGSDGSTAISSDPADFITVTVSTVDSHVSYGTKTDDTYGDYSYVAVSGLTPYVYTPTGAGSGNSSDYTNVLGMAEEYGEENGIVVASNAGIFYNAGTETQYCFNYKEADGVVISNGVVLKSAESIDHTECDILVIDENGNVGWAPYHADADGLVAGTETWYDIYGNQSTGKIVSAVTGFVPILVNSTVVYDGDDSDGTFGYDNYVGHYTQSAVRQIFGVKADGTYMLLSGTWTLEAAAEVAKANQCVFAYNLDGGGSAETVIGEYNTVVGNSDNGEGYAPSDFVAQSRGTRTLPTYLVFTASNKAPVSATASTVSAAASVTTYSGSVTLSELIDHLTVTETFTNANGAMSTRTVYSMQGVDSTQTLSNAILGGGSDLSSCTVRKTSTAPNGTLYYTKTESDITTCLKNNSNTRQSENYYDYSSGYTLSTTDDLTTAGTKTISVSYVPGGDQDALTTTFTITVKSGSSSGTSSGGSSGSGHSTQTTDSNVNDADNTTGIVNGIATVEAAVSDGTASVTVNSDVVSELIRYAVNNGMKAVFIQAETGDTQASSVGVTLSASDVAAIATGAQAALSIDTGIAAVTIQSAALSEMSESDLTVAASRNEDNSIAIRITANGETQSTVAGGVRVSIPVDEVSDTQVIVLISEDGSETILPKSVFDENGNMAVTLEGSATIKIADNAKTFDDVSADGWSADSIAFVTSHELFNGTGDGIFEGAASMNRGMLMTVLYRLESKPDTGGFDISFDDVTDEAYYADAVKWGVAMSITNGTGSGFDAEGDITRQDLAVMLYRYAGNQGTSGTDISGYSDAGSIAGYAQEAMSWAVANGVINGTGEGLDPTGSATREQVAAMITRLVKNVLCS